MSTVMAQSYNEICDSLPGDPRAANFTCGCAVEWDRVGRAVAPTVTVLCVSLVASAVLLVHARFHLSRLRFRLAARIRCSATLTHLGALGAAAVALSPLVLSVAVAGHVAGATAASCPAHASTLFLFIVLLTWSTVLGLYGLLRWWADGWAWSRGVQRLLACALASAFVMYVGKTIADNNVCAACMTYTFDLRAMLFVLNLLPLIVFTYLNEDASVPVDVPGFLKRAVEFDPLDVVVRMEEAVSTRAPRANGVYMPVTRGDHPRRYVQRHRVEECYVERRRVAALSYWVLVLPAEASSASEAGRPARVLYARCSDSPVPPCGTWFPVSEARAFYVDEHERICVEGNVTPAAAAVAAAAAESAATAAFAHASGLLDASAPGPASVTVEHSALYELEVRGNRALLGSSKRRRRLLAALYVVATLSTLSSGIATYMLPAFKLARWSGFYSFFALLWIEASGVLRKMVGIQLGAGGVTFVNVGCRVVLLVMAGGVGGAGIFDAVCVLFALFASPLAWALAEAEFPTAPPREVMRKELIDAIPSWLFSSAGGNASGDAGTSVSASGGNALSPLASMESCIRALARKRDALGPPPSREEAERTAAVVLCWAVLAAQSLMFGLFALVCFQLGLASRFTLVAICAVALAVAFARFYAAYYFYGHAHNTLPHKHVVMLGGVAAVVGVCSTFALWNELRGSGQVSWIVSTTCAVVGCNASLAFTLGIWAYYNWASSDFVFLHYADAMPGSGGSAGLGDFVVRVARRAGATILGFLLVAVGQVIGGSILVTISGNSVVGWLYTCISLLTLVTFCGFKAYFCTLRVPTSSILCACGILVGYGFVVRQVGGLLWAVGIAVAYVLVVLTIASIYQWWDNDWRVSWSKTRGIILAVTGMSIAAVGSVVAVANVAINGAGFSVRSTVVARLVSYGGGSVALLTVFAGLAWAQREFSLPPALAVLLASVWTAYVVSVGAIVAYYGLLSLSMAAGICLLFCVGGLAIYSIKELRGPADPRRALLLSPRLLPAFRAQGDGSKLEASNSGVLAGLAAVWIALVWSLVVSYFTDRFVVVTVSVQAGAFVLIVAVPLHNAVGHRNAQWMAWRSLRSQPDAIFLGRDAVQSEERISGKDMATEIADLTMSALSARTGRVPLVSPSLLQCGCRARLMFDVGADQCPYYLVSGSPDVAGLYIQLSSTHDGVRHFGRIAKGATVTLRRERVIEQTVAGVSAQGRMGVAPRCWVVRAGERLLYSCFADDGGSPPTTAASWVACGQPAASEGIVVVCGPHVRDWAGAIRISSAIAAFDAAVSVMAMEEARMVARFDVELASAARSQAERERRVLWSFITSVAKRIPVGVNRLHEAAESRTLEADVGIEMHQFSAAESDATAEDDTETGVAEDGDAILAKISAMSPCAIQVRVICYVSVCAFCALTCCFERCGYARTANSCECLERRLQNRRCETDVASTVVPLCLMRRRTRERRKLGDGPKLQMLRRVSGR